MLKFWSVINRIFVHWMKKLALSTESFWLNFFSTYWFHCDLRSWVEKRDCETEFELKCGNLFVASFWRELGLQSGPEFELHSLGPSIKYVSTLWWERVQKLGGKVRTDRYKKVLKWSRAQCVEVKVAVLCAHQYMPWNLPPIKV